MALPFDPPLKTMLAKAAKAIPREDGWLFEPKWDGFRIIIFRDGDDLHLQSRSLKPLLRYFPELKQPCLDMLPPRCVVDGELILQRGDGLDFDALQMRIHPAKSRIDMLAQTTPAQIVLWDLLAEGDDDLRNLPFGERRRQGFWRTTRGPARRRRSRTTIAWSRWGSTISTAAASGTPRTSSDGARTRR
jgi:ATP-dependent DNA ligase